MYSVPGEYLGQQLDARADSELVKLYHRGKLVKTHPRQRPGQRRTDKADLPQERSGYALRDLQRLRAVATRTDKRDFVYRGTIDVASIRIWLRDPVPTDSPDRP